MPVHILGHPVDMDPILEVAGKYNLKVIADSAESLGALYKEKKVGSLGDICCLSFNGNKIITTGGGGMLLTDNGLIAKKARYLVTQAKDDPVEYIHNEIGYNYRLTNIQAAMGVAQMEKLDEYLNIKTGLARCYEEKLEGICGISPMPNAPWAKPSFWLYTVRVDPAIYGLDSRALMRKLKEENIASRPLWHPLHSLKIFKDCYSYRVEIAEELHREALSLPSSVGLSEIQQDRVVGVIRKNVSGLKTLRRKTRKRCRI